MLSPAAKTRADEKPMQKETMHPVDENRESKPVMPAAPPGVPSKVCEYCGRSGHWKEVCPKFAADHRCNKHGIKESAAATADFKSIGKICSICGWTNLGTREVQHIHFEVFPDTRNVFLEFFQTFVTGMCSQTFF